MQVVIIMDIQNFEDQIKNQILDLINLYITILKLKTQNLPQYITITEFENITSSFNEAIKTLTTRLGMNIIINDSDNILTNIKKKNMKKMALS